MRKYTRPTYVKAEEIDNINETIFMFGSGDVWTQSTCFHVYSPVPLQGPGIDDLSYYIYQFTCKHDSSGFEDKHHNKGQNFIVTFNQVLPAGTVVTTNAGIDVIPNIDGQRVMFTRTKTAEVEDMIDYDDVVVAFDFSQTDIPESEWFDTAKSIRILNIAVNDYWLRTVNPSLNGGQGG